MAYDMVYDEDGTYIGPHVDIPNQEVLKAGVKHAEDHLAHWDQRSWFFMGDHLPDGSGTCGTTACLAGHILLAQGVPWGSLEDGYISKAALDALGLNLLPLRDRDAFAGLVFGYTHDYVGNWYSCLEGTTQTMALLKKRITDVTGIEFE